MKQILIIGAGGCVGTALNIGLKNLGYSVYGTRRKPTQENMYPLELTDKNTFKSLPLKSFDVVIHNASLMDQHASKKLMKTVNVDGTANLISWVKENGCKHFIYISSTGVYGLKAMGQNITEHTSGIISKLGVAYQTTKAAAEKLVINSNLDYSILRFPAIIGKSDTAISPAIINALTSKKFFTVGRANKDISIMALSQFPQLLKCVIDHGPTNDIYNALSDNVPWNTIVEEYAKELNVAIPNKVKPFISVLWNVSNKDYLQLAVNSKFGMKQSNEKFLKTFKCEFSGKWKEAIKDSVDSGSVR